MIPPNAELVAIAWIKGIAGIPAGQVATTLPQDASTWAASGAIEVTAVGGDMHDYAEQYTSAVSVDAWAVNPNSGKPPFNKAWSLAQRVVRATYGTSIGQPDVGRTLTMPAGYEHAQVISARVLGPPPRNIPASDNSYAHVSVDIELIWRSIS